jgi:hypothetical protein
MCKCHNLYMAKLDFGKEKMEAYRRTTDRVGEPAPSFELCPGTPWEPMLYVAGAESAATTSTESGSDPVTVASVGGLSTLPAIWSFSYACAQR